MTAGMEQAQTHHRPAPDAGDGHGEDYWREQDEMAREMEEYLWRNSRRW